MARRILGESTYDKWIIFGYCKLIRISSISWITISIWYHFYWLVDGVVIYLFYIGWYTRIALFLSWILTGSLHSRNYMVGHGGDLYFQCILFFSLFLPLGKKWSLDSYFKEKDRGKPEKKRGYALSVGTSAFIAQVCYLYVFAYYWKTHDWWVKDYLAAYYAIRLEYFQMPFGSIFLSFPTLLKVMCISTLWWEGWGTLFYASPIYHGPIRMLAAVAMMALHFGFSICLRLGTFFWITFAAQWALIPSWWWDEMVPELRKVYIIDAPLKYMENKIFKLVSLVEKVRNFFMETSVVFDDDDDDDDLESIQVIIIHESLLLI